LDRDAIFWNALFMDLLLLSDEWMDTSFEVLLDTFCYFLGGTVLWA
jgi:hypothetical protein